jgi:hypothetical protein
VVDVSPDPRATSVSSIDVVLSETIVLATLTSADFTLTRDGGANLLTGAESVTFVSGTTYRLNGLAGLTGAAGTYTLTVSMTAVQDLAGNSGTGSAADSWTLDSSSPTVVMSSMSRPTRATRRSRRSMSSSAKRSRWPR